MIKLKTLQNSPLQTLKEEGWKWMLGEDTLPYVTNDMVVVTENTAEAYYKAGNELYEMLIKAAEHVIKHDLYEDLGIPPNLVPLIKYSWENDKGWHLYGRFDLAGGIYGKPIKLIEFNADTATCIPETAIIQWASLKANGFDDSLQFNTLYESLVEAIESLREENQEFHPSLLISTMAGFPEDDTNMEILAEAAKEAGFDVAFENIENVDFSPAEGIFKHSLADGSFTKYDFWFKLIPWEFIAWDEPELCKIITDICMDKKAVVLNPAYTMLFQSKGILKVLWDLFPNHPLLLETKSSPISGKNCIEKVMFGREGANLRIISSTNQTVTFSGGEYAEQKKIYQEFIDFPMDDRGYYYQAGVFYVGESCGLGFRKGGKILDNTAQFCGHLIE
ncbi:glutathionylspermidine synthase family protein [Lacihabitans soyangensis]|uniref:Glutathionylspermidine synthase family protein n=1 Tax=Lacihabitans soyangensis TaxID=869394 RepID=A0AAE3H7F4_9BACT|nr:glutathionylspermidine synthase family protein [Lacihabitans soyangensis]MCP9765376.1 glutathionylspermidine synthase family protein [Lacihabitans soyangensis]